MKRVSIYSLSENCYEIIEDKDHNGFVLYFYYWNLNNKALRVHSERLFGTLLIYGF